VFYDVSDTDFTVTSPDVVLMTTVDGGTAGWTQVSAGGSKWAITSGPEGSHCGLESWFVGGGSYKPNTDSSLQHGGFSLAGKTKASLSFYIKHQVEKDYDTFRAELSTDGGASFTQVGPVFTNTSAGWPLFVPVTIDLTPYCGKQCVLRLRFTSDGSNEGWGVGLDDILVVAT